MDVLINGIFIGVGVFFIITGLSVHIYNRKVAKEVDRICGKIQEAHDKAKAKNESSKN